MNKVWVLEDDSYDYRNIIGIFSSYKNASVVADAMQLSYRNIVEYELDPIVEYLNKGMWMYEVLLLWDGVVESSHRVNQLGFEDTYFVWDRPNCKAYAGKGIPSVLKTQVWAKNETIAIKKANKIRLKKIADGEWKKIKKED